MDDARADHVARYFDRSACCGSSSRRRRERRLHPLTRGLLGLVEDAGLAGRTVLDVGSGTGALALALHQAGAAAVTGVDLSPRSVLAARAAAERAGVPVRFRTADAATDRLEVHDVVVLNAVLCCYHDARGLVASASAVARSMIALSLPHSSGPRGRLARWLLGAENAWRRLRRDPFRAYVHDVTAIDGMLERGGWSRMAERDRGVWHVATYERRGRPAADSDPDPTAVPGTGRAR